MKWWKSNWIIAHAVFLAVYCLIVGVFYVIGRYHAPPPSPAQKEKMAEVSVLHADRMKGTTVIVEVNGVRGLGLLVNREKDLFCWTASYIVREIGFGGQAVFHCTAADGTEMSLKGVVILYEEEEGMALLRFAVPPEKAVDLPSVAFLDVLEKPKEGEKVSHTHTLLMERKPSFSEGVVLEVNRRYAAMQYDVVTCRAAPGSGGGGIFRANGQCLGMVSRGSPEMTLIITARRVHALAERKGIPWASDPSLPIP